jgi:hypothetical protein
MILLQAFFPIETIICPIKPEINRTNYINNLSKSEENNEIFNTSNTLAAIEKFIDIHVFKTKNVQIQ